jgi:hypothetical protein
MQDNSDNPMCFRPEDNLRRKIKEAAERADRSVNGQVLHLLKKAFAAEEANSK